MPTPLDPAACFDLLFVGKGIRKSPPRCDARKNVGDGATPLLLLLLLPMLAAKPRGG